MPLNMKKAPASAKTSGATTKVINANSNAKAGAGQDNCPIISAVAQYNKDGLAVVPLPNKSKAPTVKWGDNEFSEHDFTATSNVAIKCGDKSGGVIDIDCDSPEASYFAGILLPETGFVFGHSSNPNSHYFYKSSVAGLKTKQFKTESGECLIEFRANGSLTVVPPSVHPTGESITFAKNTGIKEVDSGALVNRTGLVAALSLMAKLYPTKGSRHEYTLAISSVLARANVSQKDAEQYVSLVCKYACDGDLKQRIENVKTTYKRFISDKPITGHETLCAIFGEKNLELINKWLGYEKSPEEKLIESINKKYAFTMVGGKCAIICEKSNGEILIMKIPDFHNKLRNMPCIDKQAASHLWLESENRREYDGIIFYPAENCPTEFYNLYRGYSVEPLKGDCGLFLEHIQNNICNGNKEHNHWLLAWFAHLFQNPLEKAGTAIVLIGGQGTGKSLLAKIIGSLIPAHFLTVSQQSQITGRFNSHLQDTLLMCAEEAHWAGSKAAAGTLKDIITNDEIAIERKGLDIEKVKNYSRFILTSNEDWVAPAGEDERRFAVFRVNEDIKQNHEYFQKLVEQMNSEAAKAALLHHLLNYEYEKCLPRKIPLTNELMGQKLLSLHPVHQYWYDCLVAGELLATSPNGIDGLNWPEKVKCTQLFDAFRQHSKQSKYISDAEFGKHLKKCCPSIQKKKISGQYGQKNHYCLPSLAQAREEFSKYLNQEIEWEVESEDIGGAPAYL